MWANWLNISGVECNLYMKEKKKEKCNSIVVVVVVKVNLLWDDHDWNIYYKLRHGHVIKRFTLESYHYTFDPIEPYLSCGIKLTKGSEIWLTKICNNPLNRLWLLIPPPPLPDFVSTFSEFLVLGVFRAGLWIS